MRDRASQLVRQADRIRRRAARQRRRQMMRELAEYRTPAERADLMAAVNRCSNPGAEEIRRLLNATALRTRLENEPHHLHQ
jgi:hypothetical protein